jgi:hypothetical protein
VAETRDGMAQHPLFDGSHSIVSKPAGKRSYLHWGGDFRGSRPGAM